MVTRVINSHYTQIDAVLNLFPNEDGYAGLLAHLISPHENTVCSPRFSFAALSDAIRRGIIDQLGRLVVTHKVGRVRTCTLGKRGLAAEAEWMEVHRQLFGARFNVVGDIINEMNQEQNDELTR